MLRTTSKTLVFLLILTTILVACGAATSDREAAVAARGAEVMPFDLDRTTHIFEKQPEGGLQQVISDDGDTEQIALIREHLQEEAERFQSGNFHDPAMIHGDDMAGLHELVSGADRLSIVYSEIDAGAQIVYAATDDDLVEALHAWFDQQVSYHGRHAIGH